jgi:TPP-dependent pyruvate/acetoin dehydrogenase alpha subunit
MKKEAVNLHVKLKRRLLESMLLIRRFEEKIIEVYSEQDMKTPVHLYIGQEAIAAGVCIHLDTDDYIFTTHRSHGHSLAKGASPQSLYAEFYGKVTGCCRGKGGSMHPAFPEIGMLGTSAIVGGAIPLAVGTALASALRGNKKIVVSFFGDGASEEGAFFESLNFAALKKLPVLFICENNNYATSSPLSARQPNQDIYDRAASFDIPTCQVDGNDVEKIWETAHEAVWRARNGDGPSFIECRTYRWLGHVGPECDWEKGCRPHGELIEWMERCPVKSYRQKLMEAGLIDDNWYTECLSKVNSDLEKALSDAKEAPFPDAVELEKNIYKDS